MERSQRERNGLRKIIQKIAVNYDYDDSLDRREWYCIVAESGLGRDPRTAENWLRLATVLQIARVIGKGRSVCITRGIAFESYLSEMKEDVSTSEGELSEQGLNGDDVTELDSGGRENVGKCRM